MVRFARYFMICFIPSILFSQKFELISPEIIDLGKVFEDSVVEGNIKFMNSGDKDLLIAGVRTSCGCTVANMDKNSYLPGEEGEITVRFNTRGFSGVVRKSVSIKVQDVESSTIRVIIQANVRPKLEVEPRFIDLQGLSLDNSSHKRKILIKNNWNQAFHVNEVKSSVKKVEIIPDKFVIGPGSSQTIEIKYESNKKERINSYILLEIDKPIQIEKRIPIFINVMP
jgi:hypothetical protein